MTSILLAPSHLRQAHERGAQPFITQASLFLHMLRTGFNIILSTQDLILLFFPSSTEKILSGKKRDWKPNARCVLLGAAVSPLPLWRNPQLLRPGVMASSCGKGRHGGVHVKPWTVSRRADHTCVRRDLTHPLTRGVIPQDFLSMQACLTVWTPPTPVGIHFIHWITRFLVWSLRCWASCSILGMSVKCRKSHITACILRLSLHMYSGHLSVLCGIASSYSCGSLPAASFTSVPMADYKPTPPPPIVLIYYGPLEMC